MVDVHLPRDSPPDWDNANRIRIGWIGVIVGYTEWAWIRPEDASEITGATPRELRYWSDAALISHMSDGPHCHRRYMRPELQAIQRIALGQPITTKLLRQIVAYELQTSHDPKT